MVLNVIWTTVFFKFKMMKLALLLIYAIIALTILTAIKMYGISIISTLLLIPYLLWLSFASYLNLYIIVKN